jgi:ABC-2 type transport system ATP-binding protein
MSEGDAPPETNRVDPAARVSPLGAEPVLRVQGLRKSFAKHLSLGRVEVLRGVSFDVRPGEIYGLLGPNGAGKTTTIKATLGLLRPDSGTVSIFGMPVSDPRSRRRVGFLPENPYYYDYLTAPEFLDFAARLVGMERSAREEAVPRLLERVGLARAPRLPLRKFSKGMVQRVGLAQALLGDPEFVVLDEPMSGLDPIGRREFRDIILSLRDAGRTVFFSSHILQDAELICDRVGILKEGALVREGHLAELMDSGARAHEVTVAGDGPRARAGCVKVRSRDDTTLFRVEGEGVLEQVLGETLAAGGRVLAVVPIRLTLEEIFLREIRGAEGSAGGGRRSAPSQAPERRGP